MTDARKLFGTDGIRGEANVDPMTPELVVRLGRAIAMVARRNSSGAPRIVVGKDTRLSGYMLETALAAGICAMGGRVMLCGPMPTPAVANLTQSMRADAGVVISASHNPYYDNGIKIFGPDGFKLPDEQELEIERLIFDDGSLSSVGHTGARVGRAERIDDATGRYIVYAKSTFPRDLSLGGLRVVVDAAHGAAYKVAPQVFGELGADVTALGVSPNGRNINKASGALHPEGVIREVGKRKAHVGIALDGDADRLIVVDETGAVVDGDAVMAMCAARMIADGRLAKKTVVATVMSNMGLEHALARAGGRLERTAVGDRYVVERMRGNGFNFGGEQSGHLIFLEHATTGDGVVAALQVLAILAREQKPLSELKQLMQAVPQVLESIVLPERRPLEQMTRLQSEIRRTEGSLGGDGRVLVRWSGTEPKLRLMVEGPDENRLRTFVAEMSAAARADLGVVA
ncbi:MAG: phosphoglucosamine mutase [Polyangiaceae bacterium]